MGTPFTIKQKQEWGARYFRYLDSFMKMCLADLPDARIPKLRFGTDEDVYTNNVIIHVGLERIEAKSEEEMLSTVSYMLGHEIQHIRSTSEKAWKWGQEGGLMAVCEELSAKLEGRPRRFNKPRDYGVFLQDMNKLGYKLSLTALRQFVHFVMNSLEDGRIERIRSIRRPGFHNFMVQYRGREWNTHPVEGIPFAKMDAREKLTTMLNQVLTLSTMSIYQKGFTLHYAGTDIEKSVRDLMPNIARGVASSDCRGCMKEGIDICRKLGLDIAEASKLTPIEELISKLMEQFSEQQEYKGKSNDEETESGQGCSPFGQSDLVIELDDEEFDELAKQAEDQDDASGMGARVIFKRKNPKPDESETGENPGSGKGEGSGEEDTNTLKNESGEGSDSEKGFLDEQQGKGASGDAQPKKSDSNEHSDGPNESEGNMTGGCDGTIEESEVEKRIREAMEKAAQEAAGEVETAKSGTASTRKRVVEQVFDDAEPPDVSSISASYGNDIVFTETKRAYDVCQQMPFELQGRATVFKRKIQKLFKNQETPCTRGQKTGRIDAPSIYKLAMNEMDFFVRKGQSQNFDGCAYFLADNSGSMGYGNGSKRYHCCNALSVIEEGFSKVMPLKIVAFDAMSSTNVVHEIIKNWNERSSNNFSYNFLLRGRSGYGNKDGYSIRVATKELLSQPGKKKILVVLSDGSPSGYDDYNRGLKDVSDAVKKARASGIEVIGIYFSDQHDATEEAAFKKMYEKNFVITEPEMIGDELAKLMKRFCFR